VYYGIILRRWCKCIRSWVEPV